MLAPHTLTLIAILCGVASVTPARVAESAPVPEHRTVFGVETMLVGVRVSRHPIVAGLCDRFGQPLVSTSANPAAASPARSELKARCYFGNEVELSCGGGDGVYSRRQAEFMLRSFFRAHPPKGYTTHSRDGQEKIVGSYVSDDGRTYRVEVRLISAGNRKVVGYLHFVVV